MKLVDLFAVFLLVLVAISIEPITGTMCINEGYLSIKAGKTLRGLFSIAIVFHHLSQRVAILDGYLFRSFYHVGYICVAFFLFLSGYGLQKSYLSSENYRKGFLQKRLSKILLPFLIVAVLFWIKDELNGVHYSLKMFFTTLFTGALVNFSWYVLCICCFYVAYWGFMHICKNNQHLMIACACVWFIAYVLICKYLGCGEWCFNTAHLLILGMFWASYEKEILRVISSHYFSAFLLTVLAFTVTFMAAIYISAPYITILLRMAASVFFVLLVMMLSMKIRIEHPVLDFIGDISLELFLIHGLWLTGTRSNILYIKDDFLCCLVILVGSIASAMILHRFVTAIFKWMVTFGKHNSISE